MDQVYKRENHHDANYCAPFPKTYHPSTGVPLPPLPLPALPK